MSVLSNSPVYISDDSQEVVYLREGYSYDGTKLPYLDSSNPKREDATDATCSNEKVGKHFAGIGNIDGSILIDSDEESDRATPDSLWKPCSDTCPSPDSQCEQNFDGLDSELDRDVSISEWNTVDSNIESRKSTKRTYAEMMADCSEVVSDISDDESCTKRSCFGSPSHKPEETFNNQIVIEFNDFIGEVFDEEPKDLGYDNEELKIQNNDEDDAEVARINEAANNAMAFISESPVTVGGFNDDSSNTLKSATPNDSRSNSPVEFADYSRSNITFSPMEPKEFTKCFNIMVNEAEVINCFSDSDNDSQRTITPDQFSFNSMVDENNHLLVDYRTTGYSYEQLFGRRDSVEDLESNYQSSVCGSKDL